MATASTRAVASAVVARTGVVHDFNDKDSSQHHEPSYEQRDALLARFPHPKAAAGSKCVPEYPSTPPKPPSPGSLGATMSLTQGAFTRVDAKQSAFVIDYCPTGNGQPLTRRLLIFDGSKLELDFVFPDSLRAEAVISSVDVDFDGRSELVLSDSEFRPPTSQLTTMTLLKVAPDAPRVLGTWTGADHCSVRKSPNEETLHRITFVFSEGNVRFTDVATTEPCRVHPPPPWTRPPPYKVVAPAEGAD